jgi:2'-5' RNA ligase
MSLERGGFRVYSIELFVNQALDKYVCEIWQGLKEAGVSSFMDDIAGNRPHVSVAVYNELPNLAIFEEKFSGFFIGRQKIHFHMDAIGSFPASGTCFMSPTVTEDLLKLHREFHDEFSDYKALASPYYFPDKWIPHCTLATQLTRDKLAEALNYCLGKFAPMDGLFESVSFVEVIVDGNRCVSSRTMISEKLLC